MAPAWRSEMRGVMVLIVLCYTGQAAKTTAAQYQQASDWWVTATSQQRCDACKMMVDNAQLTLERRFQKQRKEQKKEEEWDLPKWGDTKLSLEFYQFQQRMCNRVEYTKYISR